MFGVGPAYLFFVQHRLPVGLMCSGWQPWLSTMATNVAIAAVVAAMIGLAGVAPFLLVHLPIMVLARTSAISQASRLSKSDARSRSDMLREVSTVIHRKLKGEGRIARRSSLDASRCLAWALSPGLW
jgi:fatty acid desaturase